MESVKFSDTDRCRRAPEGEHEWYLEDPDREPQAQGRAGHFKHQVVSAMESDDSGRFNHLLSVRLNSLRLTGLVR